jgi:hypothetical protein
VSAGEEVVRKRALASQSQGKHYVEYLLTKDVIDMLQEIDHLRAVVRHQMDEQVQAIASRPSPFAGDVFVGPTPATPGAPTAAELADMRRLGELG